MFFRQLIDYSSYTYTYLIVSNKEAIVIDPVKEQLNTYIRLINQLDLKLVMAIDTHTHADHITATGSLQNLLNCKTAMGEQTKAESVSLSLKDNEIIKLQDLEIRALHTPGHTDDSFCFLMDNILFTGDTLLIGGTGRTDFQNGCPKAQYSSLFDRLLTLPDDTFIYPAHDYNGMTVSTLAEEIRHNPRLQVKSCEEYVDLMSNLNLPPPKNMAVALPANLKLGCL